MQCELCGNDSADYTAIVEGAELNVCAKCAKFGKVIRKPIIKKIEKPVKVSEDSEIIETVVDNYSEIIKKAREKLGLKQEELAKKMAEKESVIHKLESGHLKPNVELAKKLENFLKINITEKIEVRKENVSKTKTESLTIGDLIKL